MRDSDALDNNPHISRSATLANWFGIPDADLDIVAPNIDNFAQRDLGFMV